MPLTAQFSESDLLITYFVVTTWSFNIWLSECSCGNLHGCGYGRNQSQGTCSQLTNVVTLHGKQLGRITILSPLFGSHWDVSPLLASCVVACSGLCGYRILPP